MKSKNVQLEAPDDPSKIPMTDWRSVELRAQKEAFEDHLITERQNRHTAKMKTRLGNTALATFDTLVAADFATNFETPGLDARGVRDLVTAYLVYRFSKGAVVRSKAAITGKGDPQIALMNKVIGRKEIEGIKRTRKLASKWSLEARDEKDLRAVHPAQPQH